MYATQTEARAAEMRRVYAVEWYAVHGTLTAIEQILEDDFPAPDDDHEPTRYQVDALRGLGLALAALIGGYERRG